MFDLDGTLSDSRPGITRCIQHALGQAGAVVPPPEDLTRYVGPPLARSFATLLGTSDAGRIEAAIGAYRARYEAVGIFESRLYPGIREMLSAFEGAGHEMCVVTAKPTVYARRVLEHFDVSRLFRGVYGPGLSARDYSKTSLIRDAIDDAPGGLQGTVMLGDRAEDVQGARSNAIGAVAVAWGYGTHEELEQAMPDRIVTSTGELEEYVRQGPGG
jgi:phosphoglycolate phosphatase